MKTRKWLWVTLTVLLTLVVLAGVAAAGFRMGVMQGAGLLGRNSGPNSKFPSFESMHRVGGDFHGPFAGDPHRMQEFGHNGPGPGRFDRGRGGFWMRPIFGLIELVVFALLLWGAITLFRKSGWRLVKVNAPEADPIEAKPLTKKKK